MEINKAYPCDARNYRKGRRDSIKYIVIHYVGATGSARNNAQYYATSNVGASAHFFVGHASENGAVYQSVDPADCAWHCGSETGKYYSACRNDSSIGIELCCHKDAAGTWYFDSVTVDKAVELTKQLMGEYGIDADHVIRHYDVTHKTCPAPFVLDEQAWADFKQRLTKEEATVPLTVQTLREVYVQTIDNPLSLGFYVFNCPKRSVWVDNYFNAGFFAKIDDGSSTIPVGNLADCGNIISQSKDNADWINVAKKKLTTIYTTNAGGCGMVQTDDLSTISDLRAAVSGIPIARGGQQVSMDEIKAEGYFGNECYWTWHGFLGIRSGQLVYVAANCEYGSMFWILRALGIGDAIKLDGGGSFILHNGYEIAGTDENPRINNCGMWEG